MVPPMSPREISLDTNTTKREIETSKMHVSIFMPLILTAVPFVLSDIPFITTHQIPAVFFFAGYIIAWLLLVCIMTRITFPDISTLLVRDNFAVEFDKTVRVLFEKSKRAGYLAFLLLLFGLSITSEFLTLASIYYYNDGERPEHCVVTCFAERTMRKYFSSIRFRVLISFYSMSNLLSKLI